EAKEARARHQGRALQVYPDEDGMFVVRGRLEPEVGAMLVRALEAAREALYAKNPAPAVGGPELDPPTPAQRQAGCLAFGGETGAAKGLDRGSGSDGTRWSCTWMPPRWPTPGSPASRSSRTEEAFLQKRPGGWRVMPPGR